MIAMGFVMHRFNNVPSDYFRAGGAAPWWLCGTSALMSSFSAWSFTGAAGRIYEDGFLPLALYGANVVAFFICWLWFAARFRQMRVITYVDAIVRRYGAQTGRFYVWVQLIFGILSGAIMLNGLAVFLSAAFGAPMWVTVIAVGAAVTVTAMIGGSWAVLAGDFIQMLIVVVISVTTFVLVLMDDRIGGISGLLARLPKHFFHPTQKIVSPVLYLWIFALLINQIIAMNNLGEASTRFLTAGDSKSAKRAALIPAFGLLAGPLIWAVPALAAIIIAPDLAKLFPTMARPSETAYVATAQAVLPLGFMGLLVCAMFSATMSSMDAALNRAAGILVMNIYAPLRRLHAGDQSLVRAGKITTALLGVVVTAGGLFISQWRTMGLFDLVIRMTAIVVLPLAVPMFFGLWLRPLPRGIAMISASAGVVTSLLVLFLLPPAAVASLLGMARDFNHQEWTDISYAITVFSTVAVSSAVLLSGWWRCRRLKRDEPEAGTFFKDVQTPVIAGPSVGDAGARVIGNCTIFYGAFVLVLAVVPNTLTGHICYVACALLIIAVGWLVRKPRKKPGGAAATIS
jgi:Na+/proline symporter